MSFPYKQQFDSMDCGPTCLKIISSYYGKELSIQGLRDKCQIDKNGVSLLGINEAATQTGFRTAGLGVTFEELKSTVPLPCIAHWNQNHFIVVYKLKRGKIYVSDPASGLGKYKEEDFISYWSSNKDKTNPKGFVLALEPTADFYKQADELGSGGFKKIWSYLFAQKKLLATLILALIIGSILQFVLPFFTQSVIDIGVASKDVHFLLLILLGQLMISLGSAVVDLIRSWIMLHISTRINLTLISDYWVKLMKLPYCKLPCYSLI